jgi:N-sulfoglucosamine sulfohydrolase
LTGGKIKPLVDRTHFVSSVDILPTVLELLGLPPLAGVDGRSWVPLIRGESQPDRDFVVTHVNTVSSGKNFAQRCVRTATHSYLWMAWPDGTAKFRVEAMSGLTFNAMNAAGKTDERIAARVKQLVVGEREQFFDLRVDPDERKNLVREAEQSAELARLRKLLLEHMRRTADPQLEAYTKTLAEAGVAVSGR